MKKVFKVGGMHCKSCNALIEDVLGDEEGVKAVKADFETGTVEVEYDEGKVDERALKLLIENEGYEVDD